MKRDIANIRKRAIEQNKTIKCFYPYQVKIGDKQVELKLVYNEESGLLDGFVYEREYHKILMIVLRDFNKLNIPLNIREYRAKKPDSRVLRVMFNKAGGNASKNAISNKMSLPSKWVSEMGMTKDDRKVLVTFDGDKIVIEKLKT